MLSNQCETTNDAPVSGKMSKGQQKEENRMWRATSEYQKREKEKEKEKPSTVERAAGGSVYQYNPWPAVSAEFFFQTGWTAAESSTEIYWHSPDPLRHGCHHKGFFNLLRRLDGAFKFKLTSVPPFKAT